MKRDPGEIALFLRQVLDGEVHDVRKIGAGSWSECFGFSHSGRQLAAKFGIHLDDFERDSLAYRYKAAHLPVPETLLFGTAFDGYFSVAPLVPGKPLETLTTTEWVDAIPSIVDTLEALRVASVGVGTGWGAWDNHGRAANDSWRSYLLDVHDEDPTSRVHGWRDRLRTNKALEAEFLWGVSELERVASNDVPRGLVHNDMMNRNVHVDDGRISGVFDWGISLYGDHLYDLALIDFWSPWYPAIDTAALVTAAIQRWSAIPGVLDRFEERWAACWLRIGVEHIGWNVYLDDTEEATRVAERMRTRV